VGRLVTALSFVILPVAAIAASPALSFTARSLNFDSGNTALLALDGQGNAYQVTTVTDSSGRAWIRVTKTNAQGVIVATIQFGGTATDTPTAIKVDAQGEVVIAGTTNSKDFPVTNSIVPTVQRSAAFVVKVDSGLTGIIASTLIGGSNYAASCRYCGTGASALDVDSAGNIYLAGYTAALDFPVTAGAYQTTPPGYDNFGSASFGFVAEISPGLSKIVFATYFGSDAVNCMGSECIGAWGSTGFVALAVDTSGAIIASADVYLRVAPPPPAVGTTTVKFAPGGGSVVWSTAINPNGDSQEISALALDGSGNVLVVGVAENGAVGTAGTVQPCFGPNNEIVSVIVGGFIGKLSGSSGAVQFLTGFGCEEGSVPESVGNSVSSVAVDASGTIWITGTADPSTLPVTPKLHGSGSSYVAALAPDGSSVEALYEAGAAMFGQALALTSTGNPMVLGGAGFLMLPNTAGGPSLTGVANSAGSVASGLIAPAELMSFYGTGLGPATPLNAQVVNGVVQSNLGGYQLLFGGVAAPLLYIGANQINAVVPSEVSGKDSVSVTLVTPTGTFSLADLYIRPSEPEIFHDPVVGTAVAINQDGTLNSSSNPAHAGELVSVWGTGAGAPYAGLFPADGTIVPISGNLLTYPALPVSVLDRNDSLEVVYAGDSPGEVFGLLQVNFRLPQSWPFETLGSQYMGVSLQVGAAIGTSEWIYVAP
jgi:uncharacterized protein (TIGR03437 family)